MDPRNRTAPASRRSTRPPLLCLAAGLALMLVVGCGSDSTAPADDGPIPASLRGEWRANVDCAPACSMVLWWEGRADTLDLLPAPFWAELDLRLERDGAARMGLYAFGSDTTVVGTAEVQGNRLILQGPGGVDTVTFQVSGDLLDLQFHDEIDLSTISEDPAFLRAVLRRR